MQPGRSIKIYPAIGGERYILSKQLLLLLVGTLWQIGELAVNADDTIRQPLMSVVPSASEQRAKWLVQIWYTVPPKRHLGVSSHATGRDTTLKHINELLPVQKLLLSDVAPGTVRFEPPLDRVEEA